MSLDWCLAQCSLPLTPKSSDDEEVFCELAKELAESSPVTVKRRAVTVLYSTVPYIRDISSLGSARTFSGAKGVMQTIPHRSNTCQPAQPQYTRFHRTTFLCHGT